MTNTALINELRVIRESYSATGDTEIVAIIQKAIEELLDLSNTLPEPSYGDRCLCSDCY